MRLFTVMRRHAHTGTLVGSMVLGILSGAASTALVILINEVLFARDQHEWNHLVLAFVGLCILLPIVRYYSLMILLVLGARTTYDLRIQLCRRILAAPLRRLEKVGSHRLLVTLTDDIGAIVGALLDFPPFIINIAVVVSSLIYIGYLSPTVLGFVLVFMVVGGISYQLCLGVGIKRQELMRHTQDGLFEHFRGATQGSKELIIHRPRRKAFLQELESSAGAYRDYQISSMKIFILAANWGNLLFFIAIGLLLFSVVKLANLNEQQLGSVVLLLIYISPSLQAALQSLPGLTRADVSVRKVESLGISLVDHLDDEAEAPEAPLAEQGAVPAWEGLELADVKHSYHHEEADERFTLGPINLTLRPGELTFLAGGNGSGKTTLAKLLLGLYTPEGGEIRFDGQPITLENLEEYRQNFSVVFSDFYLFESLLGADSKELEEKSKEYLKRLRLSHKVRILNGRFSTTDLSTGQRKRLALLNAYLEDCPIFVFDEWAADQDPEFKDVFYKQLLPELKARGKAILAITHDDRYYHLADQLVWLDFGQQREMKDSGNL